MDDAAVFIRPACHLSFTPIFFNITIAAHFLLLVVVLCVPSLVAP